MTTALTATGPLALPEIDAITEQLETGAQLTDARCTEENCPKILDTLPPEIVNQVFDYLEVPDRLVLRLLCRKTHASISRPGLLHKHEIARKAPLLKRDRFNKACQIYREYPDPRVLPCARCMMVHPMEMFFDTQIEQRHEECSCKAEGIITACPVAQSPGTPCYGPLAPDALMESGITACIAPVHPSPSNWHILQWGAISLDSLGQRPLAGRRCLASDEAAFHRGHILLKLSGGARGWDRSPLGSDL